MRINGSNQKRKKYAKLIEVLKGEGYPVEELYNAYVKTHKSSDGRTEGVPRLSVIQDPAKGFHQEFMSNYGCFSESWRGQIDIQKR